MKSTRKSLIIVMVVLAVLAFLFAGKLWGLVLAENYYQQKLSSLDLSYKSETEKLKGQIDSLRNECQNDIDKAGYDDGRQIDSGKGFSDGKIIGYNEGKAAGFREGEDLGREVGYAEAKAEAQEKEDNDLCPPYLPYYTEGKFRAAVYDGVGVFRWYAGSFSGSFINHDWGSDGPLDVGSEFTIIWDGDITLNHNGSYGFVILSDGATRFYINGQEVSNGETVYLIPGIHSIKLEYEHVDASRAWVTLYWQKKYQ